MLSTLRQRRYYGLIAACLVVATVCLLAGTWQIARFDQKRSANHLLRSNNGDPAVDVSAALGPVGSATNTGKTARFRHVTATGTYLRQHEVLVRGQTVGDSGNEDSAGTGSSVGYLVVTPLQTRNGILLIVRGFIEQTGSAADTPKAPAAPTGTVTVEARLEPASIKPDKLGKLPGNQVDSLNVADTAARLGAPVWNGYAELLSGQPGTAGLIAIPNPSMSNPAGGAQVPQHAAYVVQWYLFAGLALALPFVLAAAERRRDADAADAADAAEDDQVGAPDHAAVPPGGPVAGTVSRAGGSAPKPTWRQRRAALDDRLAGRR
ncbi:SURF1 family protein [Jatrophihabitans telluris]|uniref:SURF1-like protein n=1 Tax=Jatrophihabitans telluris TaxID=2038343 RepID=A0ABY4QV57_9ACTN|nr:SURF1 family protein [Jatrophihabitans telluris]UQX87308.1 SURF1 family protein [Jatrophihabitans telluris]